MRRREKIREEFLSRFRHHTAPTGPKGPRDYPFPSHPKIESSSAHEAHRESAAPAGGRAGFQGNEPIALLIQQDGRGRFRIIPVFAELPGHTTGEREIEAHCYPLDPLVLESFLQPGEKSGSDPSKVSSAAQEAGNAPLWVRIPQGEKAQEIIETIVRLLSPSGATHQDGLKALLGSSQFQKLFQGGQLAQGATQLLPGHQLVGILLPPGVMNVNPEAVKAFLIAEGLPPQLIQSIPDRALSGALNTLLASSRQVAKDPMGFLQSIAGVLALAGIPENQVQTLLLKMMEGMQGMQGNEAMSSAVIQQFAGRMLAVNNPQILGLNQMVQNSFGQGIAQIFNSFIRVFLGGALLQSQSTWPQVVPNERMLAELGGILGAQKERMLREKDTKRRSRRRVGNIEAVDGELHGRVERKEDPSDEPPWRSPLDSIFIETDEED